MRISFWCCAVFSTASVLIAGQASKPPDAKPPTKEDQARQEMIAKFLGLGKAPDPEAVNRGQALFIASCGFCHGSNANGGNSGPDLVRSVLTLHDAGTGSQIGPVILNGRPEKGMPKFAFTDAQIKDIAAFLLSRSQGAANRAAYTIGNIVTGDAKAGEAYFNSKCSSCHSTTGDLAHIATKYDPVTLQGRLLYPHTAGYPGMGGPPANPREQKTVTVTVNDGKTVNGRLLHLDDFIVVLLSDAGKRETFSLEGTDAVHIEVHDPLAEHARLLPQYSNADMHNILAFLETLQ
jgi:cytochrome c oxidase cbb3-type subunit III